MAKVNKYQAAKERARQMAIDWQIEASEMALSCEGVAIAFDYFERLAKRYGLIREFRGNGII